MDEVVKILINDPDSYLAKEWEGELSLES
jgi:hypothetical protein